MEYLKRLFFYSKRYLWLIITGCSFSFVATVMMMVNPYISKLIVDDALIGKNFERLPYLVGLLFGVSIARAVIQYFKFFIFEYVSQKVIYDFRSDLYDKLQAQSFEFYDKVRTGHLMNRMVGDLNAVRILLSKGFINLVEGAVTFVFAYTIMFSMNIKLTLILSIILPFLYYVNLMMARQLRPVFRSVRNAFEKLTSAVQENITGIRVVKAFGNEKYEKKKFYCIAKEFTDRNIQAAEVRSKFGPLSVFINGMGSVIVLLAGGYMVIRGEFTIGSLVAFDAYVLMLSNPVNQLTTIVNRWVNALSSLEKIFAILDEEPAIKSKKSALVLKNVKGDIKFKGVYFKYKHNYVLKDINLHMPPGSVTAIMGATGSGKSTIINLIARFYDCTRGQVLIDGKDVRDLELNSLRKNIGIILQDTFLFSDTIAANIAFGKPSATMEEIERAARMAEAHDFIMSFPQGYDTVIGERGVGLSGGQRQRIAIARVLLCDPKILILDDATSSLDMETEFEIQKTLKKLMKDRTTIIIAHRVSSVKDADRIVYLQSGMIAECGTHEELIKRKGLYYKTFVEQCKAYNVEAGKAGIG